MSAETKVYPVSIDVKVHVTDGDAVGSVTFGMGLHQLPSEGEMPAIIEKVLSALPDGFRLMNRAESTMYFLRDLKGYRGPNLVPPRLDEGERWHDIDAEDAPCCLYSSHDDGDDE